MRTQKDDRNAYRYRRLWEHLEAMRHALYMAYADAPTSEGHDKLVERLERHINATSDLVRWCELELPYEEPAEPVIIELYDPSAVVTAESLTERLMGGGK